MRKTIMMLFGVIVFTFLVGISSAYEIQYNWNDLKSFDVADDLAYDWGYTTGYDDFEKGKGSQPKTLVNKYGRVREQTDPDMLGSELAYKETGKYLKGYRAGYEDAKTGKEQEVSDDFLNTYTRSGLTLLDDDDDDTELGWEGTTTYGRWNIETLNVEQGIENLAYSIGYDDAKQGNAKAPLKLMYDLSKDENTNVRSVYEWIRENRGTFITKYKEGYEAYTSGTETRMTKVSDRATPSTEPSQQSQEDQEKVAYDLGYELAYATARAGESSAPYTIENYEWLMGSRYETQKKDFESYYWYTTPNIAGREITRTDVEIFHANEKEYIKGYRAGYEMAVKEMNGEDGEISEAKYVWQLGCELGKTGGNPYTYNWLQRAWAKTPEDLDMVRIVRYNRGELLKGYKACK